EIVLATGKEDESHFTQPVGIARLEAERRVELGAGGGEIAIVPGEPRQEDVRGRRRRIVLDRFREVATRRFILAVFHGGDAGMDVVAAASAAKEEVATANENQCDDRDGDPHRRRKAWEASTALRRGQRVLDLASADASCARRRLPAAWSLRHERAGELNGRRARHFLSS